MVKIEFDRVFILCFISEFVISIDFKTNFKQLKNPTSAVSDWNLHTVTISIECNSWKNVLIYSDIQL